MLQNLRGRVSSRLKGDGEAGFTLIELLVVMLILGILASVALPAFFNQKGKAGDAKAKEYAHSAQVAMETCSTENSAGNYAGCTLTALRVIEPTIPTTGVTVTPETPAGGYTIVSTGSNSTAFTIKREATGAVVFTCTVTSSNRGGCPGTGTAAGVWG